jgi:hypothetical protein
LDTLVSDYFLFDIQSHSIVALSDGFLIFLVVRSFYIFSSRPLHPCLNTIRPFFAIRRPPREMFLADCNAREYLIVMTFLSV